jgi:hypothetical protein
MVILAATTDTISRNKMPRQCGNTPGPTNTTEVLMTRTIPLTRGYVTIVDDEDYEWLSQFKWCSDTPRSGQPYAKRYGILGDPEAPLRKGHVKMHRDILGLGFEDGNYADHISGDTLDNRRCNLRRVSKSQNAMNRAPRANSKTGVNGVSWCKRERKYTAYIKIKEKQRSLGYFTTLEEAAAARREAEEELFGEYGYFASQAQSANQQSPGEKA